MLKSPSALAPADLRTHVFEWLATAAPILRASSWGRHLSVNGIDVVDAAIAELNVRLLAVARQSGDGSMSSLSAMQKVARFARDPYVPYRLRTSFEVAIAGLRTALPDRASVLFWPINQTHVQQQAPVARALEEMGLRFAFLTKYATTFRLIEREGFRPLFGPKVWKSALAQARTAGVEMAMALEAESEIPELPPFAAFENGEAVSALRSALASALPRVHQAVAVCDEVARQIGPDVIVPGNVVTLEGRIAARRGKAGGTAIASIMHGAVGGGEPLDSAYIGDKFLVFGERSRRELVRLGNDPRMLVICGEPHLDVVPPPTGTMHRILQSKLRLDAATPFVLLATSGAGHCTSTGHLDSLIEAVSRISGRMPSVTFVAKLHPKDSRGRYDAIRAAIPESRLLVFEHGHLPMRMFDWLQGCRAVVTTTSFAALEAMLMRVPVITLDFAEEFKGVDFIDAGATLHARNEEQLWAALETVLQGSPFVKAVQARAAAYIDEAFYLPDGNAGRRCAQVIAGLAAS